MIGIKIYYRIIASLSTILLIASCNSPLQKKVGSEKNNLRNISSRFDTIKTVINNNDSTLSLLSIISKDTADIVDYREDKYSSPIILKQILQFYINKSLTISFTIPIKEVLKKTISKTSLTALETPIYEICLSESLNETYFYIIKGSDYCNGSECPEFIGIYSMLGKKIYEGISTQMDKRELDQMLRKFELQLNNENECTPIEIFK